jgi:hypothetical protein
VETNIIPITDLESQRRLRSAPSVIPQAGQGRVSDAQRRLEPATGQAGASDLLSCLMLVAPSGMAESDRANWLSAARMTLSGIPADLLARGCKIARETCRFPSEIVPSIMTDAKPSWERRKRALAEELALQANRDAPRLAKPDYVTADEAKSIIEETLAGFGQPDTAA